MADGSKWTVDQLKEHFEARIEALDARYKHSMSEMQERFNMALAAADRAVTKAETASEKRFEGVNEFRNTLSDQQRTLMPRTETEIRLNSLHAAIDRVEHDLGKQVGDLTATISQRQAETMGIKSGWGWAVAVVALVGAALAIVFAFTRSGP